MEGTLGFTFLKNPNRTWGKSRFDEQGAELGNVLVNEGFKSSFFTVGLDLQLIFIIQPHHEIQLSVLFEFQMDFAVELFFFRFFKGDRSLLELIPDKRKIDGCG